MVNKNHRNAVDYHKGVLERDFDYRCQPEFNIPRNGQIKRIDCACFHKSLAFPSIGMEFESSDNWNLPQVQSNAEDLKAFAVLFGPNAKVFHKKVNDVIDFTKELEGVNVGTVPVGSGTEKVERKEVSLKKSNPFILGPVDLSKKR